MEGKVDENRHTSTAPKCLIQADNRAFARRHLVAGLLAQPRENRIEPRILELLREGMPAFRADR